MRGEFPNARNMLQDEQLILGGGGEGHGRNFPAFIQFGRYSVFL